VVLLDTKPVAYFPQAGETVNHPIQYYPHSQELLRSLHPVDIDYADGFVYGAGVVLHTELVNVPFDDKNIKLDFCGIRK
jgi:hypothetical protein